MPRTFRRCAAQWLHITRFLARLFPRYHFTFTGLFWHMSRTSLRCAALWFRFTHFGTKRDYKCDEQRAVHAKWHVTYLLALWRAAHSARPPLHLIRVRNGLLGVLNGMPYSVLLSLRGRTELARWQRVVARLVMREFVMFRRVHEFVTRYVDIWMTSV